MVSELTSSMELDNTTIADNFTNFHQQFSKIHDECFIETVSNSSLSSRRNYNSHPWITTAISKSCKYKSILYKKWIRVKGTHLGPNAYEDYKLYRSKLRDIIKNSKVNYFTKR